jgi:hypothetical protein
MEVTGTPKVRSPSGLAWPRDVVKEVSARRLERVHDRLQGGAWILGEEAAHLWGAFVVGARPPESQPALGRAGGPSG